VVCGLNRLGLVLLGDEPAHLYLLGLILSLHLWWLLIRNGVLLFYSLFLK
jgi:hypothetical protein